jgi:hypothetical protein
MGNVIYTTHISDDIEYCKVKIKSFHLLKYFVTSCQIDTLLANLNRAISTLTIDIFLIENFSLITRDINLNISGVYSNPDSLIS